MYRIVINKYLTKIKVEKYVKALYILHKRNRKWNLILIATAMICFSIVYFTILHTAYKNERAVGGETFIGQNNYNVTLIGKEPTIEEIARFNQVLQKNDQLTVYTASPISVFIQNFSGDEAFTPENTKADGEYMPVYGLQVNAVAKKLNQLEMDAGRFFKNEDFQNYNGKGVLPVVLGSDFYQLYDIGDILNMRVYGQNIQAEIIGFLKSEQTIVTTALPQMSAGHQVLIPTQQYRQLPSGDNTFAKQSLLASANTMLITNASKIGIRDIMLQVSQESDFWSFTIGGAGGITVNIYNKILKANPILVYGLFIIVMAGFFISLRRIQQRRNDANQTLFRILITSGMAARDIRKYVKIEASILLGIALLIPAIPFMVISQLAILPLILYVFIGSIIGGATIWRILRKTTIEMEQKHV